MAGLFGFGLSFFYIYKNQPPPMRKYILYLFIYISSICSINGQDQNSTAIAFYTTGLDHYNKQNYEDAIVDYTKAIVLNQSFAEAYFQRGCAKHNIDDYKGAVEDFNTSIKLQPNNEIFYKQRASSKTMLKDYNGAISDCDQAIAIKRDYNKAYALRGILKIEMGEKDGALIWKKQANTATIMLLSFLKILFKIN